ncbi:MULTISPECIES: Hsp20/alpha crystallin family protein [Methanobrevibacter]|jgi:HSP20 family protein|uniref:Hsp20/alpha crystallin family protein n=1 Tax=Methanobrevibacter TaxID=2172 RepID=UPI000B998446|nr:Hsp20/alpha crystallin family protein [Methanobrevibacter smithii]
MVEKDIIETKISEGKEKAEEKIDEQKEKAEEKINYRKEKLNEKREQTKNMAGKMTEDLSRGFDDLQEGIKSIQKIIDQKIDDYKKATIHSLDVDLIETEEKYYLKVDVPGIEKEEIDIEAGDKDISIVATFKPYIEEIEEEDKTVLISDIKQGRCSKSIRFSNNIEIDKISAKFNNGTVLITIPKLKTPKNKINVE